LRVPTTVIEEAATTDRYEVVRRIGAGGMGVVYEVEDKERGTKVALKTINDPNVEKVYQLNAGAILDDQRTGPDCDTVHETQN